jgi:hypothetical protein
MIVPAGAGFIARFTVVVVRRLLIIVMVSTGTGQALMGLCRLVNGSFCRSNCPAMIMVSATAHSRVK